MISPQRRHAAQAWILSLICALACIGAARAEVPNADATQTKALKAPAKFVKITDFDLKALLGEPPADDSAEHKAEFDTLLKLQADRTPEQVKQAKDEEEVTAFVFSEVLGSWFNPKDLPVTAAFLTQVYTDTKAVSAGAKKIWNRPRPPLADSRIQPCVALEPTGSFPSGHATRGVVWATVLGEMFPEQKDKLMARGKLVGEDRLIGGVHYPSDVAAGQKLGTAIAEKMLANPDFKTALEKAKEECMAGANK